MFTKVLIAEDFDTTNVAVTQLLKELEVEQVDFAKYCDDALLKIKRALLDGDPYQLLISDLCFKEDFRAVTLKSGEALIEKAKEVQPELKTIVYSMEDKSFKIKSLFDNFEVDGYVVKDRKSIPELKEAILKAEKGERYVSPDHASALQDKTVSEIDSYDLQIIRHLASGITQDEIELTFKEKGITPNSKSTIEKRINRLRMYFGANNNVHLIAIAKDMGVI
ncbi:response regulator [Flavobacterium sp. NRK F10]|uniref:response regulator n=1 Tax=Flavobacterium sp. NRK F10 TaxID=2954931 RepID=UPI0020911D46|nr:response regulator [Flavobacterium sp. NRK F10]MCO6175362.1 response regulator [Flavobacterium sp. NRK F10]